MFCIAMALAMLLTVAMPSTAVAAKPDTGLLCVDNVTGQYVRVNSASGRCPRGSSEVPNGIIGSISYLDLFTPKRKNR